MGKAASKQKQSVEGSPEQGSFTFSNPHDRKQSMEDAFSKMTVDHKDNPVHSSKTLHSSLMTSSKKSSINQKLSSSLNKSIQWAEELAVDMEERPKDVSYSSMTQPLSVRTKKAGSDSGDTSSKDLSNSDKFKYKNMPKSEMELSELEVRLTDALKKRLLMQSVHESPKPIKNLNSILLKFPNVKRGFEKMRDVFESVDTDKSGSIDYKEWSDALTVGMSMSVPEDLQTKLWKEADVDGNDLIDFREFILVITFLYLMGYINVGDKNIDFDPPSPVHLKGKPITIMGDVEASIELVVDAFLFFDKDGNGRIQKDEVMEALVTMGGVSGGKYAEANLASGIWRKRFEEMDCDNSGCISFTEFILAFENWVGFDEDEDDDEDDDY